MLEGATVTALLEAQEKLDDAMRLLAGLREANSIWTDLGAVRGALVLAQENVQHADALIHSILDKGR